MPDVLPAGPTLFDAFVQRVEAQPDATAFIFVDDAGELETPVSNRDLDTQARRIAATLLQAGAPGQPVMLLYTPGLDYISALLGCLYAGCIAVPAYPPLHPRQAGRVQALIDDARAPVVLTNASWFDPALVPTSSAHACTWIHTGRAPHADIAPWTGTPSWRPDDTVVLQYTSGSTGQPKGVMLSAGNLTHNVRHMAVLMDCGPGQTGVTWLPPYHDMGLIAGILLPLFSGLLGVVMTPASFAQRPVRWLQAMSRHRAVITGGPNAAYELCLDKVSDEQLAALDLSAWRVAVNGAEPVRASTLHRFAARFGGSGFRSKTFYPCFGLAEATLFATGGPWMAKFDAGFDPARDAQAPVPLGPSLSDQAVCIANPDTCMLCPDGTEGEVWLSGPSVAQGYWHQPERSAQTFGARLHGDASPELAARHWLRTGDLGRWQDGALQVTGRIKDQINLGGRKLHPQDIEQTAQRSHAALRKHSGAAFAVPGALRDHLVLVQELEPRAKADLNAVLATVRQALACELDAQPDDIVLVKAGVVDKTSSGKVRRSSCRQAYLDGQIEVVARSQRDVDAAPAVVPLHAAPGGDAQAAVPAQTPHSAQAMLALLRTHLASLLAVAEDQIDARHNLAELGVDSLALTRLQGVLDQLGSPSLPLSQLFQQPLGELAAKLLPATSREPSDDATGITRARSLATPLGPQQHNGLNLAAQDAHAPFPLTPLQQAYVLGRGEVSAHVFAHHDVSSLDITRLQSAWATLCRQHPMLRMRLADWPLQRIARDDEAPPMQAWAEHDWQVLSNDAAQAQLALLTQAVSHQVLPADGPLYAIHLVRLPEGRTHLLIGIDMLIADATSLLNLLADWGRLYAGRTLPALALQFSSLTAPHARPDAEGTADAAHVTSSSSPGTSSATRQAPTPERPELPGAPDLPLLTPSGPHAHRYQRRSLQLDAARWASLRRLARGSGITPAMLLLRAYAEVLGLFAREPRFTLMLTLFNRPAVHPQVDKVVGDFTAVLPLPFDLSEAKLGNNDFSQALRRTQADFLHAMDRLASHPQACDGLAAQREHRRLHGTSALPLSAFVFTCLLRDQPDSHWLGEPLALLSQTPQVWLDHQVMERDGALHVAWDAREACFPPGLLDQMFAAWQRMLHTLADQARTGLPLTPHGPRADGRSALLSAGRTPSLTDRGDSPEPPCEALHAPFLRQAAVQQQAPALRSTQRVIRYGELAERSAQVAHAVRAAGAQADTLVGIVMDKGWEQVVAALGITRSGAAYLPIDAELPAARIAQLIHRGEVRCVLVQTGHPVRAQLPPGLCVIEVGEDQLVLPAGLAINASQPLPDVPPNSLAYVVFTSGSTGEPKGVAMAHAATLNTVLDINARSQVDSRDVVLALSALNFDLSVWDIFGTLAAGACIAMPEPHMRRDTAALLDFARQTEVSIVNAVPALVQLMMEHAEGGEAAPHHALPPSLRWVLMSGDWIPVGLPDRLRALRPAVQLLAMGGATEAAIWSNAYPIEHVNPEWPSIPYGRALRHQQMVVLDHAGHPRPTWVPGEIHIGGVGLAQGYWRDAATTASRFVTHPHTGQRLYRTGDLGRHLPSGDIEFLGRMDHQVKVAGHRIEPGEIEHQARQADGVQDVLVMVQGRGAAARLIGFATRDTAATLGDVTCADVPSMAILDPLRQRLRQHLPAYMQPAQWLLLDHWPLSANGKVDRQALMAMLPAVGKRPSPDANGARAKDLPAQLPESAMQASVHALLCHTWGLAHLPMHTSFLDLGLNSIDLMRAANALGQQLGVRPGIHHLFEGPTVAEVAALIEAQQAAPHEARHGLGHGTEQAASPTWSPLTPSQRSLWLLEQLHPQDAVYNEPAALHLRGPLHVPALQAALHDIVCRHDSLRMRFALRDGEPMQRACPPDAPDAGPDWQTFTLNHLHDRTALQALLAPWAHQPFDLGQGPLLRAALVTASSSAEPEQVLALVTHHLVSDGWSQAVFIRELAWLYAAHCGLPGASTDALPALPLSFSAHAWQVHEHARLPATQAAREAAKAHWQTTLAEPLPVLDLPTDHPRGPRPDFTGRSHPFTLPPESLNGLRDLARAQGSTLHTVLMAAYALLLSRHSGQTALCIGTPTARRTTPELESLIGFVVDTLVMRCEVAPHAPFAALIGQLHAQMQAARQHDSLSFGDIVEALQPRRHAGRTPLFQAMFAMQNTPAAEITIAGLHAHPLKLDLARAKFDLVLEVMDTGRTQDGLRACFTYPSALFDQASIAALASQYNELLRAISGALGDTTAQWPQHALPLLAPAQRTRLLQDWSGADTAQAFTQAHPGPGPQATLLACLRHHAAHTPDALALRFEGEPGLSHRELDALSDQAARRLLQHGVQPGQLIGVHLHRSQAMLVCTLAIWKAGCAYLPLDPSYPPERLAYMAEDAALHWVLSDAIVNQATPNTTSSPWPAHTQVVDGQALCVPPDPHENLTQPLPTVQGDDLAYVIYTSGSTGRPKGTQVAHRSVWHLGLAATQSFDLARPVRMLQLASMSFDAAVIEIVIAWAHGGALHLIDAGTLMNLPRLQAVMREQAIDTAVMPPSLAALLDTTGLALRTLIVGGERCPVDLAASLGAQVRLINGYGPTETTVCPTAHRCPIDEAADWPPEGPPIGRPLPGATAYVLDAHGQLQPPRVPGELYIGGTGLALGYLNRPELTTERFVPHPFAPGQRLYRTGDLVRWDHEGRLHFIGRIDQQVKLRGMRVELGEIEAAMCQLPGVQDAVVTAPLVRGEPMLCAHIVPQATTTSAIPSTDEAWRNALSQRLPLHMVPTVFMRHAALPLLPNGKVDRRALPEPDASALFKAPFVGPRDTLDLAVLQLWEEVLGRQGFGILDNFFDLGGHSLKAMRLIGRIQQTFGVTLSVASLMQTPTVEAVAAAVRQQTKPSTSSLVPIQPKGQRPPIYFVHAAGGTVMCYHELARHMSPEQPVYGLQAQGIEEGTEPAPDLPAMARQYIDAIRTVQPHGPYRIAGWSMGGNIVFEMAQQMHLQGEEVAFLGLLDASALAFNNPTPVRDDPTILAEMFSNEFDVTADMLRQLPQDSLIETAVAMADSHQWLPPGFTASAAHRILRVYRESEASIKGHLPQPLACGATLYRTHEVIEGEDEEPEDRGWSALVQGGLRITPMPGNHINMVMHPHSEALAKGIDRHLEEVLPANLLARD
jgi:amino acid adenylation domain-containing protein